MNQLNAIIVEGTVEDAVQFTEQIVTSVFTIKTEMIFKDRIGEQKTKVFYFPIQCEGHLARFARERLKDGTKLRVVGRLIQSENQIMIFADYIEIKKSTPL